MCPTLLLCLHYVMVTVQGITQCIHSIAVPILCNGNGSGYYTMYSLFRENRMGKPDWTIRRHRLENRQRTALSIIHRTKTCTYIREHGYNVSTLLLCLHYAMVTIQGITQCIHSIAVPTLCKGNDSGYYTMYPLYCFAYTM
jgi:hypothetical protein